MHTAPLCLRKQMLNTKKPKASNNTFANTLKEWFQNQSRSLSLVGAPAPFFCFLSVLFFSWTAFRNVPGTMKKAAHGRPVAGLQPDPRQMDIARLTCGMHTNPAAPCAVRRFVFLSFCVESSNQQKEGSSFFFSAPPLPAIFAVAQGIGYVKSLVPSPPPDCPRWPQKITNCNKISPGPPNHQQGLPSRRFFFQFFKTICWCRTQWFSSRAARGPSSVMRFPRRHQDANAIFLFFFFVFFFCGSRGPMRPPKLGLQLGQGRGRSGSGMLDHHHGGPFGPVHRRLSKSKTPTVLDHQNSFVHFNLHFAGRAAINQQIIPQQQSSGRVSESL